VEYVHQGGLGHYRFTTMEGPRVVQGVFTRHGGTSLPPWDSLNVGNTVGDAPEAVVANEERVFSSVGARREQVVTAQQVHGCEVAAITRRDGGRVLPGTDGLITADPGLLLLLRFADCVPVLFYAPDREAVAIAHAGWRGALRGIAARTALLLHDTFGCDLASLRVGVGPSIGPCCYEVGAEVYQPLADRFGTGTGVVARPHAAGRAMVNLWEAVACQLAEVGVHQVEIAGLCTSCHRDTFFSHRAERGRTGRFAAVVGLGVGLPEGHEDA